LTADPADWPESHRLAMLRYLNLEEPDHSPKYTRYSLYLEGLPEDEREAAVAQHYFAIHKFWRDVTCPHAARWLAVNEQALARIAREVRARSHYFSPLVTTS